MMRRLILTYIYLLSSTVFADSSTTDWMSQIPNNRTLNQIIIPGTHDSGTYAITSASHFSISDPGPLPAWLEVISNMLPVSVIRPIIAGWSKTQPYSIADQLNNGIRYFDFRVCYNNNDFYFCHTMLSDLVANGLNAIQTFATAHPSEIIIVDFNHVYGITDGTTETAFLQLLKNKLGDLAIPNIYQPTDTLEKIRESKRQIIILMDPNQVILTPDVYHVSSQTKVFLQSRLIETAPCLHNLRSNFRGCLKLGKAQIMEGRSIQQFATNYLWHENNIHSPWPNASNIADLKNDLDTEVAFRAQTAAGTTDFFVLQIIQTENTNQVIDGILNPAQYPNNIENYEAPVNQALGNWINDYVINDGKLAMNIIIQDWFTNQSQLVPIAIRYDSEKTQLN